MAEDKQTVRLKNLDLFLVSGELCVVVSHDDSIAFVLISESKSIQKYVEQFMRNYSKYIVKDVDKKHIDSLICVNKEI